ncbi:uncharacterized protein LOC110661564 isoform X4 [Hevea brasiliensis]|uniref:uncharacterized protein LOC110661564 isoform X4 n=1 Tax=Hevea brasiliensis TaxID=3981 RepID=UPI0025F72776|nr:uncharacterized protein LOC110661564 isoform X4 [Hevea brasiliensis]
MITLNKDKDAVVKELKSQASNQKFSCLDEVMAELKYWMMQLITEEEYELQLSDLGPGMAGGDASKESRKRKREVSRKVRAMKGAATADAQTLHCESIEVPSSPTRPQEQPIPEIEVIAPAPQQIELPPPPPPPPPPSSSNIEGESSGPTVRTLSRGAQLLIQSLERNRSTRGNPDIAKVMGASICFQEDRNRLAEESLDDILAQTMSLGLEAITNQHILREKPHGLKKEILKAVQDASVAQAQLSSANEYIARMEDQMKRYEERIVEAERELEDSRAGWSADLARYAEDLQAKEEELRAKDEELQAKEEESTTKEAEAYVNAHNDLMAELKKRHPEEDFSWMNELAP